MANEGIKRVVDAALHAKEEPEDLGWQSSGWKGC